MPQVQIHFVWNELEGKQKIEINSFEWKMKIPVTMPEKVLLLLYVDVERGSS